MTMIKQHDKGQVGGGFNILFFGTLALVIVSIVLLFGMDMAREFANGVDTTAGYERVEANTTSPDYDYYTGLITVPVAALLAIAVGGVIGMVASSDSTNEKPDEITVIQNKYVDGEIRTTTKLEDELAEQVEPYLDDSDVHEIDERLDNGDSE